MLFSRKTLTAFRAVITTAFAALFVLVSSVFVGHADAAESNEFIAADGSDLTEVAQCLPSELSDGDLGRALRESGNDYLEKVFNLKGQYEDYQLDATEVEFLNCLERKGITPEVEKAEV
jgi:hypothetical protein